MVSLIWRPGAAYSDRMDTASDTPSAGSEGIGPADMQREAARRQARIGLTLAAAVIGGWLAVHVYAVFVHRLEGWGWLGAVPLIGLSAWLYVGLFIIAHDCMHGSLVPFRPAANRAIGGLCLMLYAGFSFDSLTRQHHLHHRHSGTAGDPDYLDAPPPQSFLAWYGKFFAEYFSIRELLIIAGVGAAYMALGASYLNIVVLWAVPALLSSLQLFTFGTYLPHRPGRDGFVDRHNARTNNYSRLLSLLTCFHFGYHHEHHLYPGVPWWQLPRVHDTRGS